MMSVSSFKIHSAALVGVAQCIECWPANQRVASLIPSQGTGQVSGRERMRGNRTLLASLSPSLPLSVKVNK